VIFPAGRTPITDIPRSAGAHLSPFRMKVFSPFLGIRNPGSLFFFSVFASDFSPCSLVLPGDPPFFFS